MRLRVVNDYEAMSVLAAQFVADLLRAKPAATIVAPTGETPQGFYAALAGLRRQGAFDSSRLRIFQLDEYVGVAPADPRSFSGWIQRALLDPLGVDDVRVVRLRGDTDDLIAACRDYDEALLAAGGIDIVVLGLGRNGHLGFNEPPADATSPTHVVRLSDETRASLARYWGHPADVPTQAITCGMVSILAARQKLLLVSGEHKRDILRRVMTGPVAPQTPAAYLRESADVTVIADAAAWPWPHPPSVEETTSATPLTTQWRS
jgi:glucosamine-6-phosphate deaminase